MFQKFNLLPNLTGGDNIAIARTSPGTIQARRPEFEEVLELAGHRAPAAPQARGAFRRRAAARGHRARHRESSGDPAGRRADRNLDTRIPRRCWTLLRDLNRRLGQTILMITHNPEAAAFGHRIVRMRDGRIDV